MYSEEWIEVVYPDRVEVFQNPSIAYKALSSEEQDVLEIWHIKLDEEGEEHEREIDESTLATWAFADYAEF